MNGDKDRKPEPQLGQDKKDLKDPQKQQQQSGTGQQYGEGSYSGTRQYNRGLKEHVQHHDIEREARLRGKGDGGSRARRPLQVARRRLARFPRLAR